MCPFMFSLLLSRFFGIEQLDHMVNIYVTFTEVAKLFSKVTVILHFYLPLYESSYFSTSLLSLVIACVFDDSHFS